MLRLIQAPYMSSFKMFKFDGELLADQSEYRHVVGALQNCTITQTEISYYVNQLCQHLLAPTSTHWTAIDRHELFYAKNSHSIAQPIYICDVD